MRLNLTLAIRIFFCIALNISSAIPLDQYEQSLYSPGQGKEGTREIDGSANLEFPREDNRPSQIRPRHQPTRSPSSSHRSKSHSTHKDSTQDKSSSKVSSKGHSSVNDDNDVARTANTHSPAPEDSNDGSDPPSDKSGSEVELEERLTAMVPLPLLKQTTLKIPLIRMG
jgi:hypothetical protein